MQKTNKKAKIAKKQTTDFFRERTLVLIKPDGVRRGIGSEIMSRFERAGLKIVALKLVKPTIEHFNQHYSNDKDYLTMLGEKTIAGYKDLGLDFKKDLGTINKLEIGKKVKGWLLDYMCSGPVIAMVIQGPHAVQNIRMMCGPTNPLNAIPGTIRGDYTVDSSAMSNLAKRAIKNLMHASGTTSEAEKEIALWFAPEEIHDYQRAGEEIMF